MSSEKNRTKTRISMLVWVGFILNVVVLGFLWMFVISGEVAYYYNDFPGVFLSIMNGALVVQALAIILFLARVPGAVVVGWIGGIFMAPIGLLFAEGCTVTYHRRKYEKIEQLKSLGSLEREFPILGMNKTPVIGALMIAGGLAYLFLMKAGGTQMTTAGWFLVAIGILQILRAVRLQKKPALALYANGFTITPNMWAGPYALPYSSVTNITEGFLGRTTCYLKNGQEGDLIKINFPRNLMPGKERKLALDAFKTKLKGRL